MLYENELNYLERNLYFLKGKEITDYDAGYIGDVFSEIADNNVDIYNANLFDWAKDNWGYINDTMEEYGSANDILKQIQMAQFCAYEEELNENKNDILEYFAYNYLKNREIEINDEQKEELSEYISNLDIDDKLEDIIDYCDSLDYTMEV